MIFQHNFIYHCCVPGKMSVRFQIINLFFQKQHILFFIQKCQQDYLLKVKTYLLRLMTCISFGEDTNR